MDAPTKTGLDAIKTASKMIIHEAAEATGEFIGSKISDKIMKPEANSRNVEEYIPPQKEVEILNELRKVLLMEHYKIFKLLDNSSVSRFVIRKWIEVNDSSIGFKTLI